MVDNIINLRKKSEVSKEPESKSERKQVDASKAYEAFVPASREQSASASEGFFWTTYEFEWFPKTNLWYGGLASVTFLLGVVGVVARSYFFVGFVVIASLLFFYYARRVPDLISFSINSEGIRTGKKMYPYRDLKSFWIFDRSGRRELSLETKSMLNPSVLIPLGDVSPGEVEEYLERIIPAEEHMEGMYDRIMRAVGL